MEARLSQKERELIAIGASLAAHCIPCSRYHADAVRFAGASDEEVTHALATAQSVVAAAGRTVEQVAREALGLGAKADPPDPHAQAGETSRNGPDRRMTALVSIAAAAAVNCVPLYEEHAGAARAAGASEREICSALRTARMIRAKASEKMDQAAGEPAPATAPAEARSCCSP